MKDFGVIRALACGAVVPGAPLPWEYEAMGGTVYWRAQAGRVCDIRGHGYLTGVGGLNLDGRVASDYMDAIGRFIAACDPETIRKLVEIAAAAEALPYHHDDACNGIVSETCRCNFRALNEALRRWKEP